MPKFLDFVGGLIKQTPLTGTEQIPLLDVDGSGVTEYIDIDQLDARYPSISPDAINVVVDHSADRTGVSSSVAAFEAAYTAANASPADHVIILVPEGTYDLTAGVTVPITRDQVRLIGAGDGATILEGDTGVLAQWGDGTGYVVGGGAEGFTLSYASPDSASAAFVLSGGVRQRFERLLLDNVRQLATLGTGTGTASGLSPTFKTIRGTTDPTTGTVVVAASYGSGLFMSDVVVSSNGVGFPANAVDAHPATDTTFLKFGAGAWDTAIVTSVVPQRYGRGIDIDASVSGATITNLWFDQVVADYCKTNGLRIQVGHASATVRSVTVTDSWFVATDGHSVEVASTSGAIINTEFNSCVARQSGKNNWRFTGNFTSGARVNQCRGIGANRLAGTNVGAEQDDLYVGSSGVHVTGGRFGEDGSGYTGFTNQARYGVTVPINLAVWRVTGVEATGVTGAFQPIGAETTGGAQRLMHGNITSAGAPAYSGSKTQAAAASTVVTTQRTATVDTLYIYGGTFTSVTHNGVQVATSGPVTLVVRPGDTWAITYSSVPTIRRMVAA